VLTPHTGEQEEPEQEEPEQEEEEPKGKVLRFGEKRKQLPK